MKIEELRKRFAQIAIIGLLVIVLIFLSTIIFSNYFMMYRNEVNVLNTLSSFYAQKGTTALINNEVPYESRYFVVIYDSKGELLEMNTTKVASISNQDAMKAGQKALKMSKKSANLGYLRYEKSHYKNDTIIVFLNCRKDRTSFQKLLAISVIVSALGLIVFSIIIVLASKKVMTPFAEANRRQRMFISDAGHDLKTPITIIDADAEVLDGKLPDNEWVNDIQMQAQRMKNLVEDLIYLSKLDENPKYQMIDFPLSDVVYEICQSFESLARTQHKGMEAHIEPNISFYGDQKNIERLLNVLLDNALKYSPYHGEIKVTLEKQKRFVVITVYNTCEHIDQKDLPYLFDRFYRSDQSRNSETGGYGIGLSIAKSVVEAHKGKISATTSDGKSLAIIVILPSNK